MINRELLYRQYNINDFTRAIRAELETSGDNSVMVKMRNCKWIGVHNDGFTGGFQSVDQKHHWRADGSSIENPQFDLVEVHL